jgi:hypothetical protein
MASAIIESEVRPALATNGANFCFGALAARAVQDVREPRIAITGFLHDRSQSGPEIFQ